MDEAKEQAEREKHEKRMRKLAEGGHQTSRYHENFEGGCVLRIFCAFSQVAFLQEGFSFPAIGPTNVLSIQ